MAHLGLKQIARQSASTRAILTYARRPITFMFINPATPESKLEHHIKACHAGVVDPQCNACRELGGNK